MQSGVPWLCFVVSALGLSAQPQLRVAFLGTSITCGAGATGRFVPQVTAGLENRRHVKVVTYDLCFGGAHSFTTLLLLKHTALPWKPDLVIVETGALDGFVPELSSPAIEQIFHHRATAQIPAVFLALNAKCSDENTRRTILEFGRIYDIPVAAVTIETLSDGCHPSNLGHAQIAAGLLKTLTFPNKPSIPTRPAPLPQAHFQSAAQSLIEGPNETIPLTFFKDTGAALKAPPGKVEWRLRFHGPRAAVLFRLDRTPTAMEYQIDGQLWKKVTIQPTWFLNYYLETNLTDGPHELGLRLQAGPNVVILDGLEL